MKTKIKKTIKITIWTMGVLSFIISIFVFTTFLLMISLICLLLSIPFAKTEFEKRRKKLLNVQINK